MTATLGAFIVTRDGAARLPAVLSCLKPLAERVVVYVDQRSVDASLPIAEASGVTVLSGTPAGNVPEGAFGACVAALDTDWVLHLDDDELIGPAFAAHLPRLLRSPVAWRFPRYHVWPDEAHYITSQPYYPDHQLRLVPRAMWLDQGGWPVRAHTSPAWPCQFSGVGLFHYKFLLYTRAQREARMAQWEASWPDAARDHYRAFSVVEGREVTAAPIPEPLPAQRFAPIVEGLAG